MTDKQKKFVDEYVKSRDLTNSAIKAGYSKRNPCEVGSNLLSKDEIKNAIDERIAKISDKVDVSVEKILKELAAIAFVDRTELVKVSGDEVLIKNTDDLSVDAKKIISGIKQGKHGIEVNSYDKIKALELLGKYQKMFTDRTENFTTDSYDEYIKLCEGDSEY